MLTTRPHHLIDKFRHLIVDLTVLLFLQDTVIYERLEDKHKFSDITLQHLEQFAHLGLRTLCIASTEVNEEFYDEWKHTYYKASTSIQNREKKLEEAAELIERVKIIRNICFLLSLIKKIY